MDAITAAARQGGLCLPIAPHLVEDGVSAYARHAADGSYGEGLRVLLGLVEQCPGSERLQVLSARLLDRSIGRADAIPAWFGVRDRFPLCHEAALLTLRWVRRTRGEVDDVTVSHGVLGAVDGEPHPAAHQLHCHGAWRGVLGEQLPGIEGELHDPHHVVGDEDPRGRRLGHDRQRVDQAHVRR